MRHIRFLLLAVASSSLLLSPFPARAEPMGWFVAETRVALPASSTLPLPSQLRVNGEARVAPTTNLVDEVFLRVGPIWDVGPHLFVALHGVALVNDRPKQTDSALNELRVELEPNVKGRLGDFTFNDRNRLELRVQGGAETPIWRYRNQLRVNLEAQGASFYPFLAEELFVDLSGHGLNQNRALAGVAWAFQKDTRLDVGYLVRSYVPAGKSEWAHDHAIWVQLLFSPKGAPAVLPEPSAAR